MTAADMKSWRMLVNLTQEQLAFALGISRPTIARYEAGATIPKYIVLACQQIEQEHFKGDCYEKHRGVGNANN